MITFFVSFLSMPRSVLVISFFLGVSKREDKTLIIQFIDSAKRVKVNFRSHFLSNNTADTLAKM